MIAPAATGRRVRPGLLVMAIALVVSLPSVVYPLGWDQATYGYYGEEILRGLAPYRDFWEINAPGNFFLYTAALALLGSTPAAITLLGLAETLATTGLLYRFTQRLLTTRHAVVAALLYAFTAAFGFDYWGREEPENLIGLLLVVALLLVQRGDTSPGFRLPSWWLAGVLCAAALLTKPTGGVVVLTLMAYRMYARPLNRSALVAELMACATGFAIVLGIALTYLAVSGALPYMVDQVLQYNTRYVGSSYGLTPGVFVNRALTRSFLDVGPLPALALLGVVAKARDWTGVSRASWFVLVWAALSMLTVAVQGFRHHYHFALVTPALAVVAASFLVSVDWPGLLRPRVTRISLAFVFAIYFSAFFFIYPQRFTGFALAPVHALGGMSTSDYHELFTGDGHYTAGRSELAAYLTCHTAAGTSVYITGEPAGYFLAHVQSPTRYYHEVPLAFSVDPEALLARYVDNLTARPPNYVAFYDSPLREYLSQRERIESALGPLLASEFVLEKQSGDMRIYRNRAVPEVTSTRCGE